MRLVKFKKLLLSSLFLSLPLNSTVLFANELYRQDHKSLLIAEANEDYREHDDESEDDDIHSKNFSVMTVKNMCDVNSYE